MPSKESEMKAELTKNASQGMKTKSGASSEDEMLGTIRVSTVRDESVTSTRVPSPSTTTTMKSPSPAPADSQNASLPPTEEKSENEKIVGGDITLKLEPGQMPKLARSSTQKIVARPATLFNDLPNKTREATNAFHVISQCIYSAKYLGSTEHAMECDCAEEWGKSFRPNPS